MRSANHVSVLSASDPRTGHLLAFFTFASDGFRFESFYIICLRPGKPGLARSIIRSPPHPGRSTSSPRHRHFGGAGREPVASATAITQHSGGGFHPTQVRTQCRRCPSGCSVALVYYSVTTASRPSGLRYTN